MRSPGTPAARRAAQLALRDDVHAGAEAREGLQHRLVGIRLDGVADERLAAGEGLGEDAVMPRQRGGRVAVERRPDRVGQARQVDILGVHDAAAIEEVVHASWLSTWLSSRKRRSSTPALTVLILTREALQGRASKGAERTETRG